MLEELQGYRTYIIAVLVGIFTALKFLGIIDPQTYTALMGILGATGLATLRAGVENSKK